MKKRRNFKANPREATVTGSSNQIVMRTRTAHPFEVDGSMTSFDPCLRGVRLGQTRNYSRLAAASRRLIQPSASLEPSSVPLREKRPWTMAAGRTARSPLVS